MGLAANTEKTIADNCTDLVSLCTNTIGTMTDLV